jgi:hypothetical protein
MNKSAVSVSSKKLLPLRRLKRGWEKRKKHGPIVFSLDVLRPEEYF